jgi:hypothetical protein
VAWVGRVVVDGGGGRRREQTKGGGGEDGKTVSSIVRLVLLEGRKEGEGEVVGSEFARRETYLFESSDWQCEAGSFSQ